MNLRGQVWEIDYRGTPGANGMPATLTIRGVTPQGDASETFAAAGGAAKWKSPIDTGSAPGTPNAFYVTVGGPVDTWAWFIERLLTSPDKAMKLLPSGEARASKLTTLDVGRGANRRTVTLWGVTGVTTSPMPIRTDANGKFFALLYSIGWLPDENAHAPNEKLDVLASKNSAQK